MGNGTVEEITGNGSGLFTVNALKTAGSLVIALAALWLVWQQMGIQTQQGEILRENTAAVVEVADVVHQQTIILESLDREVEQLNRFTR